MEFDRYNSYPTEGSFLEVQIKYRVRRSNAPHQEQKHLPISDSLSLTARLQLTFASTYSLHTLITNAFS